MSPTTRATRRAAARERRVAKDLSRQDLFGLIVSGFSHVEIAQKLGLGVETVRREVGKAIAARATEPEQFVAVQQARLEKALRVLDSALQDGEIKAVSPFLKLMAQLDRYHGVSAKLAAPPAAAALPAPAAAPLALTHEGENASRNHT